MWKRRSILMVLAALVVVTSSCIFDPDKGGDPPIDNNPWPDLKAKEDVLYYVQRAYTEKNSSKYESILDDGFINYLSDGDVNAGFPDQWEVTTEKTITRNLFSKTPIDGLFYVKSIDMDIQYENGVAWIETIPSSAPTEKWYTATAFYNFQITVAQPNGAEDLTYLPDANSKAQFTVRNVGTSTNPKWKLVEFRDLGAGT